ncbi:MAG: hypothetical protein L0271_12985 [Gemmatimonadetes bacterium]|nr:hypothetical protein [Gemmatimonadota bacterium]
MQRSIPHKAAMLVFALWACSTEAPLVETAGECRDAFAAQICTWTTMQGASVVEMGATIPLAAIENAPPEMPMVWPPPTVTEVGMPGGNGHLTHLTVYYEPMGHPPATYMTPHFDFHFYTIPSGQRTTIDCSNESKPAALPTGYALPDEVLPDEMAQMIGVKTLVGVCVPQMGMHSLSAEEMASETLFDGTMVVGYYNGETIFFEPMIASAYLLERRSFDLPVPLVPGLEGPQPRAFRAEYVADADAYRFVFSDFGPST